MKPLTLAAAGLSLAWSAPVAAAEIVYTLTGTYDVFGIQAEIVITGVGDTEDFDIIPGDDETGPATIVRLSSLSFTLGATSTPFVTDGSFFAFRQSGVDGFDLNDGINGVSFFSPALIGYDGLTSLAPVEVDLVLFNLPLNGQSVSLEAVGPLTFGAAFADTGAIPEPATWAMMIAGFGLVGSAMRRRALVTV